MYPHRLRLRGPWECEPLAFADGSDTRPLPPPRKMTLPCRWRDGGLLDFAGRVRFLRRFGYPGQIDDAERVWLTFEGVEGGADVWLNGQPLGRHEPGTGGFEHEVTPLLKDRNELVVEVDGPADGGLWGEVAMEVRRSAFLRGVRIRAEPARHQTLLHVSGQVVGTAERPLELYVILDRSTVAYGTVTAAPDGQPFTLTSQDVSAQLWQKPDPVTGTHLVRVDLVDGAVIWYSVERPFLGG